MIKRPDWRHHIEQAWSERRIVWLAGARRLGKTTLVQSLPDVRYFDCDLPRVRRDAEDIEAFLERYRGQRLVLDEIHRLAYWRDKQQHELDFVWTPRGRAAVAIECKWRASQFDSAAFRSFRALYPGATCWLVAQDRDSIMRRSKGGLEIVECGVGNLTELAAEGH